ncbi:MAG: efflux RND transporter periplasmic adaptor subunit [Treponema sp.]|jgi:multidrug efflux pump subunit AcrA (membrane-fusion protein)|nr:efflux RND transporter periplasmic adaptor subunit [Treponema sp.]
MSKRNLAWRGAFIVFLAVLALGGCERIKAFRERLAQGGPGKPGETPPAAPVFAVNTSNVSQGQIQDYLALSGDIVAGSTVDTYSDAAGKVTQLYVVVGSRVGRGDPIAAVDPSKPGMEYVANVVKAPIGGTVVALPAQVGMTISQQVSLARIAGGSALEIKLYVAERFISKMALGLPCEITLDAWPGEVFRGTVSKVAPTVDPSSRTMEIRINVDNPGSRLKAGMFAKVRIITEQKQNIVKIPSGAMVQRFGESYVFVAEPDGGEGYVARRRNVTPGILVDGILEIREGLSSRDEIIVRGQTLLDDGAKINIIDRVTPLGAN